MTDLVSMLFCCRKCGDPYELNVGFEDYLEYTSGALAQEAFPYLNSCERDGIILGWCPNCWHDFYDDDTIDDEVYFNEDEGFDPYDGCYSFDC